MTSGVRQVDHRVGLDQFLCKDKRRIFYEYPMCPKGGHRMKRNIWILVPLLGFGLQGCTSETIIMPDSPRATYWEPQYMPAEAVTEVIKDKPVRIYLTNGEEREESALLVTRDSVFWKKDYGAAADSVACIEYTNRSTPALVWGGIGMLAASISCIAGGAWGPQYPSSLSNPQYDGRILVIEAAAVGGLVGYILGHAIRWTRQFKYPREARTPTRSSRSE